MNCPNCNQEIDDSLIAKHLGSKAGIKSANNMTKEERVNRAKKASNKRWNIKNLTNK